MSPGLREVRPFRMWRKREIAGATPCRAISFSSAGTVAVTWREHETRVWMHGGPRASARPQGCGAPEPTGPSHAGTPGSTNPQGVAHTGTHCREVSPRLRRAPTPGRRSHRNAPGAHPRPTRGVEFAPETTGPNPGTRAGAESRGLAHPAPRRARNYRGAASYFFFFFFSNTRTHKSETSVL
jgi:hypothetical protein